MAVTRPEGGEAGRGAAGLARGTVCPPSPTAGKQGKRCCSACGTRTVRCSHHANGPGMSSTWLPAIAATGSVVLRPDRLPSPPLRRLSSSGVWLCPAGGWPAPDDATGAASLEAARVADDAVDSTSAGAALPPAGAPSSAAAPSGTRSGTPGKLPEGCGSGAGRGRPLSSPSAHGGICSCPGPPGKLGPGRLGPGKPGTGKAGPALAKGGGRSWRTRRRGRPCAPWLHGQGVARACMP